MKVWNMHFVFNFIEGIWWMGLGLGYFLHYGNSMSSRQSPAENETPGPRIKSGVTVRGSIFLAFILILFGISDFVEMATGAWWRPWWWLVWKGLCIGIGLICIILLYIYRRP